MGEMAALKRGALIVLEGCDRSGKSTQITQTLNSLRSQRFQVQAMHFPDRSLPSGQLINEYLSGKCSLEDHALHLLFSSNRWELVPKMLELLKSGTSLLVDRYAYSGVAFSAAKESMSVEWCQQCDVGLPKPDLVLYLDIAPEAARRREGYGDEVYEKVEFQARVRANFNLLQKQEDTWKVLNAELPREELSKEINMLAKNAILQVCNKLQKLWSPSDEAFKIS